MLELCHYETHAGQQKKRLGIQNRIHKHLKGIGLGSDTK